MERINRKNDVHWITKFIQMTDLPTSGFQIIHAGKSVSNGDKVRFHFDIPELDVPTVASSLILSELPTICMSPSLASYKKDVMVKDVQRLIFGAVLDSFVQSGHIFVEKYTPEDIYNIIFRRLSEISSKRKKSDVKCKIMMHSYLFRYMMIFNERLAIEIDSVSDGDFTLFGHPVIIDDELRTNHIYIFSIGGVYEIITCFFNHDIYNIECSS